MILLFLSCIDSLTIGKLANWAALFGPIATVKFSPLINSFTAAAVLEVEINFALGR